jgi:hypothetical protein
MEDGNNDTHESMNGLNGSLNGPLTKEYLAGLNDEYYLELEKRFENIYIETTMATDIDIIRYKVENYYYTNVKDILDDICFMFKFIYENLTSILGDNLYVTKSIMYKNYLTYNYIELTKIIFSFKREFRTLFNNDIGDLINGNKMPRISKRPINIACSFSGVPERKTYESINDYIHIYPTITEDKTKTTMRPRCDGNCCDSYDKLGPHNLEKGNWHSSCHDRANNLECDPELCGCGPDCKNQALRKKDHKVLDVDVAERYAWGIDLYTYRNLLDFLPNNLKEDYKASSFIEKVVIRALSLIDLDGYRIDKACEYIVNTEGYSEISKSLARHLIKVKVNSNATSFTAYSKGIGIFNLRKDGIKQNELISGYFGEIYPPWLWYEKQDIIKQKKLDKELPDFYNIMLERLKCDDNGYDLVMVDPNSKGNLSSRMSHSCVPNCNTVLMASDGKYTIGMFATKDIEYGDELTFDYNSVTEKEKEYQKAICLCSTYYCRGRYLLFSNSMVFTEVLSKHHSFLHRNAILLEACNTDYDLTEEDFAYLDKYAIRTSILLKAPIWLKKWAALILRFVELEEKLLFNELCKKNNIENKMDLSSDSTNDTMVNNNNFIKNVVEIDEDELKGYDASYVNERFNKIVNDIEKETGSMKISIDLTTGSIGYDTETRNTSLEMFKYQVNAVAENRIQNIAITIDKVIHVLDLMGTQDPPLIRLTDIEFYEHIWDSEVSIRQDIIFNLTEQIRKEQVNSEQLNPILGLLKIDLKREVFGTNHLADSIQKARDILIRVSKMLRTCVKNNSIFYEGLADMIYLHASTKVLFKHSKEYNKSVQSDVVCIRKRDIQVNLDKKYELDDTVASARKEYDRFYIWGQLIGWYKQTVDKPNASLSADRRGTLSYPEIDSFFIKNSRNSNHSDTKSSNFFNYPYGSKSSFYNRIIENPSLMWPVGNDWSFKNKNK